MMREAGFPRFTLHEHTQFWKAKRARGNPTYGVFLNETDWWWYEAWLAEVRGTLHRERSALRSGCG